MEHSDNDDNDSNHDASHEMDNLPASHPAMMAASRKRGGWQGEELELQHALESGNKSPHHAAAVDLDQFRNTEIGKGYQAKHVVRQRTGAAVDAASERTVQAIQETNRNAQSSSNHQTKKTKKKIATKKEMLANTGLREFRKEIESILNNP